MIPVNPQLWQELRIRSALCQVVQFSNLQEHPGAFPGFLSESRLVVQFSVLPSNPYHSIHSQRFVTLVTKPV